MCVRSKGRPWYSSCTLDCWSTSCAIDPAPGASLKKFISLAQGAISLKFKSSFLRTNYSSLGAKPPPESLSETASRLYSLIVQNHGLKYHSFHFCCVFCSQSGPVQCRLPMGNITSLTAAKSGSAMEGLPRSSLYLLR